MAMKKEHEYQRILEVILGEVKVGHFKRLFHEAMPKSKNQLTVILARKAYALFCAFRKAFPEEFAAYKAHFEDDTHGCVIHDRNIGEWLSVNDDVSLTKIKIVDDTLLHGSTMMNCYELLLSYGFGADKIETYVFFANECLKKTEKERTLEQLDPNQRLRFQLKEENRKEEGLSEATLYAIDRVGSVIAPKTPYRVFYIETTSRSIIRKLARKLVEVVHALSIPYIVYFPTYSLDFSAAAQLLYGCDDFPEKAAFPTQKWKEEFASKMSFTVDSTFESGELHGINSVYICAMLKPTSEFEETAMLRIYANYTLKEVLIIPYVFFRPYVSTVSDIKNHDTVPACIRQFLYRDKDSAEERVRKRIQEENHITTYQLIRYIRALSITQELFGASLDDYRIRVSVPDFVLCDGATSYDAIEKFLLSDFFNWNPTNSDISQIVEMEKSESQIDAIALLDEYSIPDVFKSHASEPIDKQAFDAFFDELSGQDKRTGGIPIGMFADRIEREIRQCGRYSEVERAMLSYAFIIVTCDRGVSIPSTNAVKIADEKHNRFCVGQKIRDGEMATEAFAMFPGLAGMPWAVHTIYRMYTERKNPAERTKQISQWKNRIKPDLKNEILNEFKSKPSWCNIIERFFLKKDYELGDYVIHPEICYFYEEGVSVKEQQFFNSLIDNHYRAVID